MTYFETNPLLRVAQEFGFSEEDVYSVYGYDLHVNYETSRRFVIGDVCINIYRMASGRYEVNAYCTDSIKGDEINDYPTAVAQAICSRRPALIKHWVDITYKAAMELLPFSKTQSQRTRLLSVIGSV